MKVLIKIGCYTVILVLTLYWYGNDWKMAVAICIKIFLAKIKFHIYICLWNFYIDTIEWVIFVFMHVYPIVFDNSSNIRQYIRYFKKIKLKLLKVDLAFKRNSRFNF